MKAKRSGFLKTALPVLLFLAGLALVLYPSVSNWWNRAHQSRIITSYDHSLSDIDAERYAQLWAEAEAHNARLLDGTASEDVYETLLDPYGTGYMGYVELPSIGAKLPIAHGVEDDTLSRAVGHLDWSSLPIGGESTHCVLSGHRGLPSAELLTNLDKLEQGDLFYIHVLDKVLEYRVDAVNVVEPNDVSLLQITEGEDYVTLQTCTPYGINSHRLLVRGVRVSDGDAAVRLTVSNEVEPVSPVFLLALFAAVSAAVPPLRLLCRRFAVKRSPSK